MCEGAQVQEPQKQGTGREGDTEVTPWSPTIPKLDLKPWEGGVKGRRGLWGTKGPPCSLLLRTSWDPVSREEAAACSAPLGPRHWAPASEEFGKGMGVVACEQHHPQQGTP